MKAVSEDSGAVSAALPLEYACGQVRGGGGDREPWAWRVCWKWATLSEASLPAESPRPEHTGECVGQSPPP